MTRDNTEGLVMLLGVGVAAWLAYQAYQTLKGPANTIANAGGAITSSIANLFPGTSPTVVPQGSVQLPSGQVVPVSSLTNMGFQSNGALQMNDGTSVFALSSAAESVVSCSMPLFSASQAANDG